MAWLAEETFESYSDGTSLGTLNGGSGWGGSWTLGSGAVEIDDAQASEGSLSALVTQGSGTNPFYSRALGATLSGTGIVYVSMRRASTGTGNLVFSVRSSVTGRIQVRLHSNGNIEALNNDGGATWETIQAYSADTWYDLRITYNVSAATYTVSVWNGSAWGAESSTFNFFSTGSLISVGVGGDTGADGWIDNITPTDPNGSASVPDAFTAGQWTVTDLTTGGDARITISSLPADGGSAITDLEYQLDAGSWTSLGGTSTGDYDLNDLFTDGVATDVKIRAVNAEGSAADSDTKSVTTTTATAPAAFIVGDWSIADLASGGDARVTITSLPSDGGSAITDLEYSIDSGAYASLGGTTTGTYDINGQFTDGVSADVTIRAVNVIGNGPDSDTKSVTTTAGPAFSVSDSDLILLRDVSDTANSAAGEIKYVSAADLKTYFTS